MGVDGESVGINGISVEFDGGNKEMTMDLWGWCGS